MTDLVTETLRLNRDVGRIMRQASIVAEAPLRLHSREIDSGGAPELHPAFLRYLGDRSVCKCGRPAVCATGCRATRFDEHLPACEPACPKGDVRYHASTHKNQPNRMKRALREIRRLNPKAYDLVYLIVARGYSWENATEKLNADHLSRGQMPKSDAEFAVLWISGASMMIGAF